MKTLLTALLALLLSSAALAGPSLRSAGGGVTLSLEGEHGQTLPTYYHRGATYVLGEMGQRYNVRVSNSTGERVEVVLTVDGRDAISGDLGDYRNQRGYLIGPYSSIVVDGFRRSHSEVAAFRFTTRSDGYSSRRGSPQHSGVVGAAVFREAVPQVYAPPQPVYPYPTYPDYEYDGSYGHRGAEAGEGRLGSGGDFRAEEPSSELAAKDKAPAASAPATPTESRDDVLGSAEPARREAGRSSSAAADEAYAPHGGATGYGGGGYAVRPAPPPKAKKNNLGTQYGESRYSPVTEVPFRRAGSSPSKVLGLYYDDYAGLQARGVIARPGAAVGGPQPFPVNRRFAPPPPAY